MENNEKDIINLEYYADALRNTGYKNTENALAEIVDNSLEAGAKDILILCKTGIRHTRKSIVEIAILDNGCGMPDDILSKCLGIGESTRRERKGMGRFGVGLPQASFHVAPRVEVYSWQNGATPRYVYLDVNEMKSGKQKKLSQITKENLPQSYQKYLKGFTFENEGKEMSFSESGTLVIWKACDRLNPKTATALYPRFNRLLGRKFRHFINDDCTIGFFAEGDDRTKKILKPNDPLCLMTNNQVLGNENDPTEIYDEGEPIFELWDNAGMICPHEEEIEYRQGNKIKKSKIEITFSLAKPIYQRAGGENKIGQHLKKNVGISIVRANREIDFGKFDLFSDINEPQHRWWGCEVKFKTELDETFGVSNNKQQVELRELNGVEYEEDDIKPIWFKLEKIVAREIKHIYKEIKKRKEGSRKKTSQPSKEEAIVGVVEARDEIPTKSEEVRENTHPEELKNLVREVTIESTGNPHPTDDEINAQMTSPVHITEKDMGDSSHFIDISTKMGNCWLTINTGSIFYREMYSKLEEKDESVFSAFKLILMAYARAEDEAISEKLRESFREVRRLWGVKIEKYLKTDYQS